MSSKSALPPGAAGHTPPAHLRALRSNTKAGTQQNSVSPQVATMEKKRAKARETKEVEVEARRILIDEKLLNEENDVNHQTLTRTLTLIIQKHSLTAPQSLMKTLVAFAALMQEANNAASQLTPILETLTQKLGERVEKSLQEEMNKMSSSIKSTVAEQCKALSPPESMVETIATLKQVAADMSKTIGKATTATTQITDTAHTYRQALLQATPQVMQAPPSQTRVMAPAEETRIRVGMGVDKKARQVLLDTDKGEDSYQNIHEIKDKAMAALVDITPPPPQDTEVQEVYKLRNGSLILQFTTKEVADWLRKPANEMAFTRKFDPDTTIRDRVHPILVPRILITFDPNNQEHLREIEEVNRLPNKTIKKARWIKPTYRRVPGQSCVHAIFTITSVSAANSLLKDGIYVCNARTFPTKLKHEPKQCMKCRKWGHFAAECRAEKDSCGTCGGQHRTNDCKAEGQKYCVSCRSNEHTSWDRNCPEFRRKCDEYNGFHPENDLVYFPTDEDWTQTTRPQQLPFEEKFPARLAIDSLPLPNRTARQLPTRPIGKKVKHLNNNDNRQAVMENFFVKLANSQTDQNDAPPARIDDDDEEYDVHFDGAHNTLPEDFLQQHKP